MKKKFPVNQIMNATEKNFEVVTKILQREILCSVAFSSVVTFFHLKPDRMHIAQDERIHWKLNTQNGGASHEKKVYNGKISYLFCRHLFSDFALTVSL